MRPGEIYLARFPFGDFPGMKLRPVLLLTGAVGSVPEVLFSYISSAIPSQLLPSDLVLDPVHRAGFQGLEDQQIERPLQYVAFGFSHVSI
jgi:hypothetical protein